jgi:hypothetical protein
MYFLRMGDDYLDDSIGFKTLKCARDKYKDTAAELFMYGQSIQASIHKAPSIDEVVEYPDYVLSYDGKVIMESV